jgi:signal transduction histidine kinase/DNA-binding response OmpR family regulator
MQHARKSLRARLTLLVVLLTVSALAMTGFHSWRREAVAIAANTDAQLRTLARMIAVQSRSGVEFDDATEVRKFLTSVTATMQLQAAAVYLADGARYAAAGATDLLPADGLAPPPPGDLVVATAMPYRDDKGEERVGKILVRTSSAPGEARLREHVLQLVLTGLFALAALGIAAQWLLRRLLRPIQALVATTHEVRRTENWALRAISTTDDEIGTLVHAFNGLLHAVQERDRRLAQEAERLEQQVRERTAELSTALEAAQAATRAKSTFVANMSHEIRTPLNAILGMTELAMESEDGKEQKEYLGVIRSAGANLLGILCDILDLSKIESDKLELAPVPTDIEAMFLDALRPLTSRIQSKDLDLSFELAPGVAAGYRVDDIRLRQILTNLVGNAIKFTSEGHVRVTLRVAGTHDGLHDVELVVEDTGVGIPSDRLQAIFTPFTQADSTITRRFAGTGLGLSITDRLVRLMGGSVRVESTVGKGSTFFVTLPLQPCDSPLPPPPAPTPGTRLLLVSRSASLQRTVGTIAARLGVPMLSVDEPSRLPPPAERRAHDVALFDDRDPDRDAAICEAVPLAGNGVRPLFVVTSFQDLPSAAARCRDHQYAGYLTKPISARELAVRLAQLSTTASSTSPSPAAGPPRADQPAARLRILVAEDNAVNQRLIERILARDGHEVTIAENGRICCDLWQRGSWDIVLMDMQMPEMSGLEAAAEIRRNESSGTTRTPIIALTANTTPEDRLACMHAGMDEVLPKPVSIPRLRAVLAQFGGGRPDPKIREGSPP